MRVRLLGALVCILLIASGASAQTLYFMRDAEEGPAVDGVLSWRPPPPPDPDDPTGVGVPGTRLLPPLVPVQFATEQAENNTGRILGPVIVGLWTPDMPSTDNATLRVELVQLAADDLPMRPEGTVLASANAYIRPGNASAPDPEGWLPPDPTDPQAAAAHLAAQAAAYALPMVIQPPYVYILTGEDGEMLDLEVPQDADIAIRLTLLPSDDLLAPRSAGQVLEYDFAFGPSFAYVPWFEEPEPKETKTKTTTSTTRSTTTSERTTLGPGDGDQGDQDAPGAALALALVPLAGLAAVLRRRL